jgi:hypothetical protein
MDRYGPSLDNIEMAYHGAYGICTSFVLPAMGNPAETKRRIGAEASEDFKGSPPLADRERISLSGQPYANR